MAKITVTPYDEDPTYAKIINNSGFKFDPQKQAAMPAGWFIRPGYREKFSQTDNQAVMTFIGPWGARLLFKSWALGYADIITNSQGDDIITRQIPTQHPEMPWLYATDCDLLEPQGVYINNPNVTNASMIAFYDASTGNDALTAQYAITYRDLPYAVLNDTDAGGNELNRYVERLSDPAITSLPIPTAQLKFVRDQTVVPDSALNRIFFTDELVYNWYGVPDLPEDAIVACVGRVNKTTFDGTTRCLKIDGYEPGTLLYQAPKRKRRRDPTGRLVWDISYRFLYRRLADAQGNIVGWNYFPYVLKQTGLPDKFLYELATYDGTSSGQKQYEEAEFNDLFLTPPPSTSRLTM